MRHDCTVRMLLVLSDGCCTRADACTASSADTVWSSHTVFPPSLLPMKDCVTSPKEHLHKRLELTLLLFFFLTYLPLFAPKAPRLIKGAHNNNNNQAHNLHQAQILVIHWKIMSALPLCQFYRPHVLPAKNQAGFSWISPTASSQHLNDIKPKVHYSEKHARLSQEVLLTLSVTGASSRFLKLEKFSLTFSSSTISRRINLLHP